MQWIELAAEPHDTLDWKSELARAHELKGEKIFWKLNLGLEQPFFPLDDEMRFHSLSLALTQFSNEVWPLFQEVTVGVCLYRGPAELSTTFSWTESQKKAFHEEWEGDAQLFCLEAFALYFQMLSHRLPDEAKVFILFDLTGFKTASQALRALSKERFEHFTLAVQGDRFSREGYCWEGDQIFFSPIASSKGIVFPEDASTHTEFEEHFSNLKGGVKVVFERYLSEEWEGLDTLYVLRNVSPQGERMLKGFLAAGGEIIYL